MMNTAYTEGLGNRPLTSGVRIFGWPDPGLTFDIAALTELLS